METDRPKILIIRSSALGDVAMALTVIYPLCRQYPGTDFYLLTRPFFAKIFINRPDNLHIIEADFKGRYRGLSGMRQCLRDLDEYRFTAVADLHNVLRSWIIDAWMRMRGCRVAMVDKQRRQRTKTALKRQQTPFIERYADTLARIGYPVTLDFTSVFDPPSSKPSSKSSSTGFFAEQSDSVDDQPVYTQPAPTPDEGSHGARRVSVEVHHPAVGIAPFARYVNKTYPLDQMERVIAMLSKRGINIYLFGAKGREALVLEGWAQKYPHVTSLAGQMPITDEIAMMAEMDLMVTMDSANHHLASIAATRTLSIWGSTTPACGFGAYGQSPDDAIYAGLECQPCTVAGKDTCRLGTMACMRLLTPDKIVRKITDIIQPRT